MSIKTWKSKFYKGSPEAAARRGRKAALLHSLCLWSGLLKSNLKRHKLLLADGPPYFAVQEEKTGESFSPFTDKWEEALCIRYKKNGCSGCPIFVVIGKECDGSVDGPFTIFTDIGDARPMVRVLRKAVKRLGIEP